MKRALYTAAATLPVTLIDFKLHLKIDGCDQDALLSTHLAAAQAEIENRVGPLISSTWDLYLDEFPKDDGPIYLPFLKVASITSVKYTNTAAVESTMSSSDYTLDNVALPPKIVLAYGKSWPSETLKTVNGVVIRVVGGFTDSSAVPAPLKAAILLSGERLYEPIDNLTYSRKSSNTSEHLERVIEQLVSNYTGVLECGPVA